MAETYTLNVAGLTRELTICKVNDHLDIAAFIMLGGARILISCSPPRPRASRWPTR